MRRSVVICGRPNVGKSTLFNILIKEGKALVHNRPGVTRDWLSGIVDEGAGFSLIDTAGLEEGDASPIGKRAWKQSVEQIKIAGVVLLMVDARAGLLPDDKHIATMLRKLVAPERLVLVANKAESLSPAAALVDFHGLGITQCAVISSSHNIGIGYLLDLLEKNLAKDNEEDDGERSVEGEAEKIRLALIGRPNVGKSTLANKIVGAQRMLVADMPGTTVDSVDIDFDHRGRDFSLIDTAGVRRRAKTTDNVEKISSRRARIAAERADIIIMMLDAAQGIVHQDQLLASLVHRFGKTTLLVFNKSDLLEHRERRKMQHEARHKLPFMDHAPTMLISANRPRFRGGTVVDRALAAYDQACNRNSANKVTKVLRQATSDNVPPRSHGKRPSLRYAHQAGVNPPLIIVHGRHVSLIKSPYVRYLTGQFADQLGFSGAPVQIRFKESSSNQARR